MSTPVLADNALISLEEVREALFLEDTETRDDNFLVRTINRVSARIETYCKRKLFPARMYTEYYDGDALSGELLIDNPPIHMVSGIWDDPNVAWDSNTLILSGNYTFEPEEGTIRLLKFLSSERFFSRGTQNVKVVYSGGFEEVPVDLADAALDWVLTKYRQAKDKTHGYSSKSSGGGGVSIDTDEMPKSVKGNLAKYRFFDFGRNDIGGRL
jgi:hypothetical protein